MCVSFLAVERNNMEAWNLGKMGSWGWKGRFGSFREDLREVGETEIEVK